MNLVQDQEHELYSNRTILVRLPGEKRSWTNQTTEITKRFCTKHERECEFTPKAIRCKQARQEEYQRNSKRKNNDYIAEKRCNICSKTLKSDGFYSDPGSIDGLASKCKTCKKKYDYERNNTWEVLIRSQYRTSLYAHGNTNKINPITLDECQKLLEEQNKLCNHCGVELTSIQGNRLNSSWKRASLDRINTSIIGYGNGNAQWLCNSCNKGKCTMPDGEHKEKFSKRDQKIQELEEEIIRLNKIINET